MKKKTTEEFIEKAKKIHGGKYDYSKVNYIDNRTKVCVICPKHGEFWTTPHSIFIEKTGCPYCHNYKLENEILNLLQDNNINFIYQTKSKDLEWLKNKKALYSV